MATLTPITGTLGITRAKHLLQRFTFSANRATIQQFAALTAESAFDLLTATLPEPEPPIDPKTGATWLNPKPDPIINSEDFKLFDYYEAWHLEIMRKSGVNITERMVWFLHTHFPVQRSIVSSTAEVYYQNKLFRKYALGNFKELFIKMITDNAMLRYIDNNQNEVNSPNENFARELLELYSIGKGEQVGADDYTNYTELDVKIAARVLTGFKNDSEFANLDPDTQLPRAILKTDNNKRAYLHDAGIKTFSARFAEKSVTPNEIVNGYVTETAVFDELQQMISLIFEQPETAKFLVRKLYRQFVFYKISAEVETDIIVPLAELFATEKFELLPVLRKLILSQHFFDEDTALPENKRNG
ncbi:MAG TPA: DUF1800 domain-containing protein, partial [Bacteroidales bacterium]|nr:DUF1800 domain-containing protein [Bacteroidales bacterium]